MISLVKAFLSTFAPFHTDRGSSSCSTACDFASSSSDSVTSNQISVAAAVLLRDENCCAAVLRRAFLMWREALQESDGREPSGPNRTRARQSKEVSRCDGWGGIGTNSLLPQLKCYWRLCPSICALIAFEPSLVHCYISSQASASSWYRTHALNTSWNVAPRRKAVEKTLQNVIDQCAH